LKLVVLDRDGTINHDSDQFIKSPAEWKPIKGSLEAIARLTQAGSRVVVATNQSGIGRGLFDMAALNAIHDTMHRAVHQAGGRIDAIFFCPHAADSNCECRKPKPGLLREIGSRFGVDLKGVPMIGDSLRDVEAAAAIGAQPYLVLTGKGKKTRDDGGLPATTQVFADLAAVLARIARLEDAVPMLPVLGVPVQSKALNGLDSLLSIVQMPAGVPVATVSVGGARNAGLLAARILGAGMDDEAARVRTRMVEFQEKLRDEAHAKGERLRARRAHPTGFGMPRD